MLSTELSRVNLRLARAADSSSDQTTLLDQRDSLLQQLSEHIDINTSFNTDHSVTVRLGGSAGPQIISGGTAAPLAMTTAANGTISFTLGGNPVTPAAGSLTGKAQALAKLAQAHTDLDALATGVMNTVNAAQANGAALDGSTGTAMFTGTDAGNLALAFDDGAKIATAPAGSGANSRDPANLDALRNALASSDPAGGMDKLLFDISSAVAGRKITRDALNSIADSASVALQAQAGVDLDHEAVNLIRYQQAFQASGRVIQIASDLFDSLLGIR
jgi:flagellar hook-associated protein 1 FlgK